MLKSVTVFGRKIPIKHLTQAEMDRFIPNAAGIFDCEKETIYLVKGMSKKFERRVLLHEIGHAVKALTCLDNVIDGALQEIVVQTYATLIEDILDGRTKVG